MNVAHCIHGLGLGGAQKVINSIVRGRPTRNHNFFVYACEDGVLREQAQEAGAQTRIVARISPKFDPLLITRFARYMRQDRIDLVHAHLFGDSLHGYLAAKTAGRPPFVMTLHNVVESCNRLQRIGYRWLLPRCDQVVACSNAVRESFVADFGPIAEPLVTIANGIEDPGVAYLDAQSRMKLKESLGVGREHTLLAGIGRLTEQKGFDVLIEAVAQLPEEAKTKTRLVLLGEGPLLNQLQEQAADLEIADRVIFAGFRSDINELMPAMDVVVFSSLWEGLPIALLEAMAAARCIVSTDVPGNLEAMRDGREGLVAPTKSAGRLSAALNTAIMQPELAARLGKNARLRFEEKFSAERMVESYGRLYEDLIRKRHRA